MADIICTVCPKGCMLHVNEETLAVSGNGCARGIPYGQKELTAPTRVLTSTVRIEGGTHRRLPVRTSTDIPKSKLFEVMRALDEILAISPVKTGDILLSDVCNTGADILATRDL